ncbi:hypothetical protein IJJ18_02460 [Candidatus Saccharibacteria bacterium]|nr:hypothetical protein [Candidatus Saccharibacteria bacterium]
MVERIYLGQVDKTRDYIAACQIKYDDRPDEYEVWANLDFLNITPYAFHKMRTRVSKLSGGRWRVGTEEVNIGKFIIREDRNRPGTEYDSDRAISDVLSFILASEKPGVQEIAEKRLNADILRKAAKDKSAAR